jgi:hypothetical protein
MTFLELFDLIVPFLDVFIGIYLIYRAIRVWESEYFDAGVKVVLAGLLILIGFVQFLR